MHKFIIILSIFIPSISFATVNCSALKGAYVTAQDTSEFLGFFDSSYATSSIMNPYGTYGSQYSSISVRNIYGAYGSPYSAFSANNPYASYPPTIYGSNGYQIGYLTINTSLPNAISLQSIDASCDFDSVFLYKLPQTPENIWATDGLYRDEIFLSWNTVSNATSYTVFYSTTLFGTKYSLNPTSSTYMNLTGAIPDQTYYFWVQANNLNGSSELSEAESGFMASSTVIVDIASEESTGAGSVYSHDGLIECGTYCESNYRGGTNVILEAIPDLDSTLYMWIGVVCEEGNSSRVCTFTTSNQINVQAIFDIKGDIDTNGTLDIRDAILGLRLLSGITISEINGRGALESNSKIGLPEVIYVMNSLSSTP